MIEIYHNNRCSKSRCALEILDNSNTKYQVVEYLKEAPSVATLKEILKKLGIPAKDLIRKNEQLYKDHYKDANLSEDEWIQIMHEHPVLIERPIVINGNKAVIARPPERVNEIL